jgi:von Willebrand factor type A domain
MAVVLDEKWLPRAALICLLLVLFFPWQATRADTAGTGLKPDVRLLIDISGSMKTSDPDNLRAPALELMVRLLPDGARAGVWIFGEDVDVLVPHGPVDGEWRRQAHEAMARIDNSGQRTNIPAALEAATYDFDRLDPGYRTSIVLLTDGKVDVGESPVLNAGAARDLLAGRAPELGATGIPVHTIALSAEADWVFLRSLARATSGIAEQAQSADALSGIFLQSLEMVAPTARVPVTGSRFSIDESVDEFTLLVFFDGSRKKVKLIAPSGRVFQPDSSATGADWSVNQQFALVTLSDPEPGKWRVDTPGNARVRVTVISDLQLEVDPLPNSMDSGRRAELGLRLTEAGQPIADPEVLKAFNLYVDITAPDGQTERIDVSDSYPPPQDGEYRVLVPGFEQSGRYEIMVRLHAQTLERELPLHVQVAPPPDRATLVTRGQEPPEDDFRAPLAGLGGVLLVIMIAVWLILRRRKKRKLEVWQRRARNGGAISAGEFAGAGLHAQKDDTQQERLD